MISKSAVQQAVEEWLEGKEYFLVDISISPDDRIVVEIDHADGVWIEDCADLSRHIESRLSRDEEDYELEVGSAGSNEGDDTLCIDSGNVRIVAFPSYRCATDWATIGSGNCCPQ